MSLRSGRPSDALRLRPCRRRALARHVRACQCASCSWRAHGMGHGALQACSLDQQLAQWRQRLVTATQRTNGHLGADLHFELAAGSASRLQIPGAMSTQGKRKQDDALEGATQGSGSAKRRSSRKPARTKRSAAKQAASVADDADVPEALRAACIVHCERVRHEYGIAGTMHSSWGKRTPQNAREGMEDHVLPCAVLESACRMPFARGVWI